MKLCYLSSSQVPSRSANSVHVMKICEAFAERGNSVTLFGKDSSLEVEPYGFYGVEPTFEIHRMPRRTGWRRKAWLRLRLVPQVWALHPDLVYGRSARSLLAVAWLRLPLVFEAHIIPSTPSRRLVQEKLFAAPSFRRLVVISELLRRDYLREFPSLCPEHVVVAHDAASPVQHKARARAGGRPRVGYVGHLYPGKGMETIQQLASRCRWADFHVVGGMEEDLEFWRPRVAALPNLTLHGFVAHGEVGDRLESFDMVLAPYGQQVSVQGGDVGAARWMSPLKIFEYMAHGKPIVATDLPVIREVLEHERNALLAPSGDLDAWEHAVRRLVDDPALRERLGGRAREDFEAGYSWRARARAALEGL